MSIIVCAFEAQKDETPEAGGGHAHARNSERALKTSGVVGSSFFITLYCFFCFFCEFCLRFSIHTPMAWLPIILPMRIVVGQAPLQRARPL